jgi:two-component system, NarL family, response regulator DevR
LTVRVLLAEDTELHATGVRAALEEEASNQVVAVAPSVELAEKIIRDEDLDVVIADIRLADGTAFDLMKRFQPLGESPRFLILSAYAHPQYVEAALRLGASGYVRKEAPVSSLLWAVRTVAAGGWAFDQELVQKLAESPQLRLTGRDRQVIAGVLAGRTNDEIGAELGISRKTVEAYVTKLLDRFGLTSRVALSSRATREEWLERATSGDEG